MQKVKYYFLLNILQFHYPILQEIFFSEKNPPVLNVTSSGADASRIGPVAFPQFVSPATTIVKTAASLEMDCLNIRVRDVP